MKKIKQSYNLALSGGGIKALAYVGALKEAEKRGYSWGNIVGVSAGALTGAFMAANYESQALYKIINDFDFSKIKIKHNAKRAPAVTEYLRYSRRRYFYTRNSIRNFLMRPPSNFSTYSQLDFGVRGYRGSMMKNMLIYSLEGSIYDGDYIEEWVYKVLNSRGIRTFGDLKTGIRDNLNPNGYRVRMTAVDVNRARLIVLPDDLSYYGINPDTFEVAKAVRMSTSIPFIFRPVRLTRKVGNIERTHYIVDGAILDNFPYWILDERNSLNTIGFMLNSKEKNTNRFGYKTPFEILKAMVSVIHDLGLPNKPVKLRHIAEINTSQIQLLDFDLDQEKKDYLIKAGETACRNLFDNDLF